MAQSLTDYTRQNVINITLCYLSVFYDNLSTTNYRIYPLTHTSFYRREGHSQGRRIKRNRVDKVGVRAARKTKKTTEGKKGKRCLWFI